MVKFNIIKKGKWLYQSGGVSKTGESNKKVYYDVFNHKTQEVHKVELIKLSDKTKGTMADCTCCNITISKKKEGKIYPIFCSHICAVIFFEYFHIKLK